MTSFSNNSKIGEVDYYGLYFSMNNDSKHEEKKKKAVNCKEYSRAYILSFFFFSLLQPLILKSTCYMRFSLLSLILCSTSLICSYVKKVNAKSQDFIDNDINSDESSLAGTPNHPYSNILWLNTWTFIFTILMRHYLIVGIPIGTWKITDLNINEKESLCQKQQNYCSVSCFTKRKAGKKKRKCMY